MMKVKQLVVDTCALVRNVALWDHSDYLITVDEVLGEIKDKDTRDYVAGYPSTLNFLQPHPESIKFINEFTKKTGDYYVLSLTDVKLLALTYELEVEINGSDHLRKEPIKRRTNTIISVPVAKLETTVEEDDTLKSEENGRKEANSEEGKDVISKLEDKSGENSIESDDQDDGSWVNINRRNNRVDEARLDDNDDAKSVMSTTSTVRRRKQRYARDKLVGFYMPPDDSDDDIQEEVSRASTPAVAGTTAARSLSNAQYQRREEALLLQHQTNQEQEQQRKLHKESQEKQQKQQQEQVLLQPLVSVLEDHLTEYSYVAGHQPSADYDLPLLATLTRLLLDHRSLHQQQQLLDSCGHVEQHDGNVDPCSKSSTALTAAAAMLKQITVVEKHFDSTIGNQIKEQATVIGKQIITETTGDSTSVCDDPPCVYNSVERWMLHMGSFGGGKEEVQSRWSSIGEEVLNRLSLVFRSALEDEELAGVKDEAELQKVKEHDEVIGSSPPGDSGLDENNTGIEEDIIEQEVDVEEIYEEEWEDVYEDDDCDDDEDDEAGYSSADSDNGWITPGNISNIARGLPLNAKSFFEPEEPQPPTDVALVTSDFAMQNVLIHIGLKVMGVNGRMIRNARTYVLRCFACHTVVPDMSKLFCTRCGNRTLKRVAVTVNDDGSQKLWISRRPLSVRGLNYKLPRPHGGQHAVMPLLTSDQRFPHQWPRKSKGAAVGSHPDYIQGESPFSATDVYSKAAMHGNVSCQQRGIYGQLKHAKIWHPKRGPRNRNKK